MRTGLGYGYGLGLIGTLLGVSILTLPDILVSGESATVAGTSNAEGQTVTVTVNGQTFGTDTVSGGAWSIAAAPTDAMKGNAVAVVATVAGVTASSTTHVLPSGIVAGFDARLGVDTTTASIDPDVGAWSPENAVIVTGTGPWTVTLTGGSAQHYTSKLPSNIAANHRATVRIDLGGADHQWVAVYHLNNGYQMVDVVNGVLGTSTMGNVVASITPLGGGVHRVTVTYDVVDAATNLRFQPTTGDGTGFTVDDDGAFFTVDNVSFTQTRATDITAQFPVGSEPVASQATAASQPAYDGASLDFDGIDDYMTLGAGLGAQTSHHLFFVMSLEVGPCQFFDAQTGRIAFGRSPAGALGWYDGSWRVISGATGTEALSMSVLEYELDGVGGTGIVRINGVTQTLSSSVYAATAIGGTIAIGSAFSGGSGWAATIMRVPGYIYPATLSAADAAIVRVALADVHGVTL